MPGLPGPFTDVTVLLLYAQRNMGKTTFAHFLSNKTHPIISLDAIFINTSKSHMDGLRPFMHPSKPVDHQIGSLVTKLCKQKPTTVLDKMIDDIFVDICKQLDEHIDKHCFIVIEGYLLHAIPNLQKRIVQHITQKKWRHWICHK